MLTHADLFRQLSDSRLSHFGYYPEHNGRKRGRFGETSARYKNKWGLNLIVNFNPRDRCASISYGRFWTWPGTGYVIISGSYNELMEYFGKSGPTHFEIGLDPKMLDVRPILQYLVASLQILEDRLDLESLVDFENGGYLGSMREKLKIDYPNLIPVVTDFSPPTK